MNESREKFQWKGSYTVVLLLNVAYIIAFYFISQHFS